jgi:hypothetical protein
MTQTELGLVARDAAGELSALTMRVIVNRLSRTKGCRLGMAPTLELVVEQAPPEDADR